MTTESTRQFTAIHPETNVGVLSLSVSDLERSLAYYTDEIGLEALHRSASSATLGITGEPVLLLTESKNAQPWPRDTRQGHPGLYHFAILLPSRADLGRWLRHRLDRGHALPGQADHLVSEALYLEDPDGHGIEIYADRPRAQWQWDSGRVQMGLDPLDIGSLLAEGDAGNAPWRGLPAGTRLGHMHLQVHDIDRAAEFYHDLLGFDIVGQMPSALFVSAGGYHHHLGMNTWHSHRQPRAPANTAELRFFTIHLPTEESRDQVLRRLDTAGVPYTRSGNLVTLQDPSGNTILLRVGKVSDVDAAAELNAIFAESADKDGVAKI
ncbi:MAG: VOC family protein [Chloroflexota bacterium]